MRVQVKVLLVLACLEASPPSLVCLWWALGWVQVEVADTVGCGDSFAAAIALGYIRGEPPATTLALANAVGAATATRSGAGRNVAEAARVAEILLGLQVHPTALQYRAACRLCVGSD